MEGAGGAGGGGAGLVNGGLPKAGYEGDVRAVRAKCDRSDIVFFRADAVGSCACSALLRGLT
jgi:hypothetical protein